MRAHEREHIFFTELALSLISKMKDQQKNVTKCIDVQELNLQQICLPTLYVLGEGVA